MFDLDTSSGGLKGDVGVSETDGAIADFVKVKSLPLMRRPAASTRSIADEAVDLSTLMLDYKRLMEQTEKRERELSTLLEVSRNVSSTLELGPLLQLILDRLDLVLDFAGAAIFELKGQQLDVIAYRGPVPEVEMKKVRFDLELARAHGEVILSGSPRIILDVRGDTELARAFRESAGDRLGTLFGYVRSWMGVPLVAQDRVIGMLSLYHREPNCFTPRQAELAMAFAHEAAVSIENARLYQEERQRRVEAEERRRIAEEHLALALEDGKLREQAEEAAVAAERNRIARDLHDAVSQTLFSASLIAEVLPQLWRWTPEEGLKRLEDLRQLTRGALAEMRSLLLELRPATLTEASLGDLLRQLVEASAGRSRLPISIEVEGERDLPPDVQVALYRIAQEALNNVVKHSGARRAWVYLRAERGLVELSITDDGHGFDRAAVSGDHLGLKIMRERAEVIGGEINVESQVDRGTRVRVKWRDREGGISK